MTAARTLATALAAVYPEGRMGLDWRNVGPDRADLGDFSMTLRRCSIGLALLLCAIDAHAQTVTDPNWTVTPLFTNGTLAQPTTMGFIGNNDFLVLEKGTGQVKRVTNGVLAASPVLDLPVNSSSERGLLGIAVHPNFGKVGQANNDKVYLYYSRSTNSTDTGGWLENRLSRFTWNGSALTGETPLATFGTAADGQSQGPNHDGGPIAFGPDGKLYGITGDLNRSRAEQNTSSTPLTTAFAGGVYRLNDDGTVPTDNPFSTHTTTELRRWYAYGIRNSFGMSFDPVTGNLWDTENGPDVYDEVNLISPGFNSGWLPIMGPDSRDPQGVSNLVNLAPGGASTYSDPEFSWLSPIAVTGIHFLAGSDLGPAYHNKVLVADSNSGSISMFTLNAARTGFVLSGGLSDLVADNSSERNSVVVGSSFGSLTDIKRGSNGELYVVSLGRGTIYRITSDVVMGDFDGDNDVDGADFVAWQTNFPRTSGATLAMGDADGDGDVDGADFVVWQTNFPTTPGGGSSPVPEPWAAGLALAAALGLMAIMRHRA
jgi:aldose sugar dehydrogenase